MAFETSFRSILLTTSKLLSGIFLFFLKRGNLNLRLTEPRSLRSRYFAFRDFSQFEKIVEIAGSQLAYFIHGERAQFAQPPRRLFHEGWLVALSPVRNRRQIRRVGLDQHTVERNLEGRVA